MPDILKKLPDIFFKWNVQLEPPDHSIIMTITSAVIKIKNSEEFQLIKN